MRLSPEIEKPAGGADHNNCPRCARRTFLGRGIAGLGLLGLNALLDPRLFAADTPAASHGVVNPLHHPAKAKRIIFLYQAGGPSHLETFDNKPKLRAHERQAPCRNRSPRDSRSRNCKIPS